MADRAKDPRLQALFDAGVNVYSFSKLSTINQCLYQAWRTYILHDPGISSVYGSLGGCVHDCLQNIVDGKGTTADLLPSLQNELDTLDMLGLDFPKDRRGEDSIKQKWLADMTHFCKTFYPPKGKFETEQLLIYRVNETRAIQGYIDLLKHNDDGTVTVLDWKSSSQYQSKDLLEHGRQLIIYGMALEQAGYKVKSTAWIMLKYVIIKFDWYATRRSKSKSPLTRIVNRSKIYETIKLPVHTACKEAGMDDFEIEIAMRHFAQTNILGDWFPPAVRAKFSIKPYVREYPYTEELKAEALTYINQTADLFESVPHDKDKPLQPCEITPENDFFCRNLCGHRKVCPYIVAYNERTAAVVKKKQSDDDEDLF